jgi:flagellar basal body-associated protein FliL
MAEEGQEKSPQKKSSGRKFIWIGVGLVFVVIVLVAGKYIIFGVGNPEVSIPEDPKRSTVTTSEPGEQVVIGEFLSNLAKPDEELYISVTVAVEIDAEPGTSESEAVKSELEARSIEIKQVVEEVLRSRNREDLETQTGVEGMRQEILRKINNRLQKGEIRQVLTYNMIFS